MGTVWVVLAVATVVVGGAALACVGLVVLAFCVDDCGGLEERRWRCTSFLPQKVSLVVMAMGWLASLGLAMGPLVTDDAPAVGWVVLTLPLTLVIAPFVITAWIGSLPLGRRQDRQ